MSGDERSTSRGAPAPLARVGEITVRRSALLTGCSAVCIAIPLYGFSSWWLQPEPPFVYVVLALGWAASASGLLAIYRDRVPLGSKFVAFGMWTVVAMLTAHDGVASAHVGAFSPAITCGALLLGVWGAIVLSGASAALILGTWWMQRLGYGPPPPPLVPDAVAPIVQAMTAGGFSAGVIYAYSRALTQLGAREAELRSSESRYQGLFAHSPDGIVLLSRSGELRAANAAARAVLGLPEDGDRSWSFSALPFDPASRNVAQELASGERSYGEVILRSGDKPRVLAITATKVDDSDRGVQLSLRDVTQAKAGEEEARALQHRLRRAERMEAFGQLAGGVAHDFNNILTGILGLAALVRRQLSGPVNVPRVLENVDGLEDAAQRGAAITKQLLLFSRSSSLDTGTADLAATVGGSRDLLRRLVREDVELSMDLETTGVVEIPPASVEQIVLNLVINARDATTGVGRIDVRTRLVDVEAGRDDVAPGRYASLEVEDHGSGIAAENLGRVFEPFFTTKEPGRGTGLGLATVHGIVRRARGHIEVQSELDKGTLFRVLLPRAAEVVTVAGVAKAAGAQATGRARGGVILVCEDEAAIRDTIREVLVDAGYRVRATSSPREALQIATEVGARLDLLLTDVIMPELNGPQLASAIWERIGRKPVLFMSGYTGGLLADLGIGEDDERLLLKPFTPAVLLERIAAIIGQTGRSEASVAPVSPG